MSVKPALTIQNNMPRPCEIWIEPIAEDYTLLPNDQAAIIQLQPGLGSVADEPLTVTIHKSGVTIWSFYNYEIQVNGEPVEYAHQRQPNSHPILAIEHWLPANPQQVYELWIDAVQLSNVLGKTVIHNSEPGRFSEDFRTDDNTFQWTILRKSTSEITQSWRTTDFPGTHGDSFANIRFEERDEGTRILVALYGLPVNPLTNWKVFWEDVWQRFFFEPLRTYFETNRRVG